jgi:hypothetical protein
MMQIAAANKKPILDELVYRVAIGIFCVLGLLLSNTVLTPVTNGVVYFVLAALFELFNIQAMRGLFGDRPLIRDASELNFYAFLIHLIAIPLYSLGVSSDWHNNAIYGLIGFYLIRLFYFGERLADGEFTGWAKFGALGWANHFIMKFAATDARKKALLVVRLLLTIGTVVPLWAITVQNNDNKTSLFTITSTAFILIYGYWKNFIAQRKAAEYEHLINDESIALLKSYNERTTDARRIIQRIAVEEFTAPGSVAQPPAEAINSNDERLGHALAELENTKSHRTYLILGICLVALMAAHTIYTEKKAMFEFGYASGYTTGKTGAKPTSETSWDRVSECHNRDVRQGPRPDSCYDKPPK